MEKEDHDCGCAEKSALSPKGNVDASRLRTHVEENLQRHKGHFVEPPPEFVKAKMDVFRIDRARIDRLLPIFICGFDANSSFTRRGDSIPASTRSSRSCID